MRLAPDDPIARFGVLLASARSTPSIVHPTAMALATVDAEGRQPTVRMVLLQHVDARGLVFYTNSRSRKGREMVAHQNVGLLFHWDPLAVQVRFDGPAALVPPEE